MASLVAWLVALKDWAKAIAAVFGFARQAADTMQSEIDRSAGRHEVEAAQAEAGRDAEAALADEALKPVSEDDAIARMKRGEG